MNNSEAIKLLEILYSKDTPDEQRMIAYHRLQELINILIPE